jgi:hypothetical protein
MIFDVIFISEYKQAQNDLTDVPYFGINGYPNA